MSEFTKFNIEAILENYVTNGKITGHWFKGIYLYAKAHNKWLDAHRDEASSETIDKLFNEMLERGEELCAIPGFFNAVTTSGKPNKLNYCDEIDTFIRKLIKEQKL